MNKNTHGRMDEQTSKQIKRSLLIAIDTIFLYKLVYSIQKISKIQRIKITKDYIYLSLPSHDVRQLTKNYLISKKILCANYAAYLTLKTINFHYLTNALI